MKEICRLQDLGVLLGRFTAAFTWDSQVKESCEQSQQTNGCVTTHIHCLSTDGDVGEDLYGLDALVFPPRTALNTRPSQLFNFNRRAAINDTKTLNMCHYYILQPCISPYYW